MGLFNKVLLGTGAAVVSVVAAQAADLPVRKAAPVEYVRICDAYGSGFFFIPGTNTCLRISGRVRADYAFVPANDVYSQLGTPADVTFDDAGVITSIVPGDARPVVGVPADSQHVMGWEARARIGFDARTPTAWGVVRAVGVLRLGRTSGVLRVSDVGEGSSIGTGTTLEAAYIQFAGFTFGAARDNFAMMPSVAFAGGHWGSFANGAKQIAYTHLFGGGLSATIALQDYQDTGGDIFDRPGSLGAPGTVRYVYNSVPQVNGRIEWNQSWGGFVVAGAFANIPVNNVADTADFDENVWAVGARLKFNLPMLARGSALWLHGAYADGMTEYTVGWASYKSSSYRRDVAGFVLEPTSLVVTNTGLETVKSWNVAAVLEHQWAPQYKSNLWVSYGQMDAPAAAKACIWNGTSCFGDAEVLQVGTNFIWEPVRNFEIGVEVLYARVEQDVRGFTGTGVGVVGGTTYVDNTFVANRKDDSVTGRLRIERNF